MNNRKLIVGYDLCEDYSQISCFSYKSMEAITLSLKEEDEDEKNCLIPTVLCQRQSNKQWLFGEEAISCAEAGEGLLIKDILSKAKDEQLTKVDQTEYSAVELLEMFLRKTLSLVKNYFPTEPISKMVVTIHETDPVLISKIYEALELLGIKKDRALIINHPSAYLYYALKQDKSLWLNDVGLFDLRKEGFHYYQIRINRRARPMVASLQKQNLSTELDINRVTDNHKSAAYTLENLTNSVIYKQLVTTLYFTGIGFEGSWAEATIRKLCVGRRVFLGQNIYSKGACYVAKELTEDKELNNIVLITDDMVTSTLTIRVYADTKYRELPLIEAGETWYELDKTLELIPEGEAELEFKIKPITTSEAIDKKLVIDQFMVRKDRTSRLRLQVSCNSRTEARVQVFDQGFGDFFPGTGAKQEIILEI